MYVCKQSVFGAIHIIRCSSPLIVLITPSSKPLGRPNLFNLFNDNIRGASLNIYEEYRESQNIQGDQLKLVAITARGCVRCSLVADAVQYEMTCGFSGMKSQGSSRMLR